MGIFFFSAFPPKVFCACSIKNMTFLKLKVNHYWFVSGIIRYNNKAQMRKDLFQDNWSPSEVHNLYAFAVLPQIMSCFQWPNIWKARTSCNKKDECEKERLKFSASLQVKIQFHLKWNLNLLEICSQQFSFEINLSLFLHCPLRLDLPRRNSCM